MFRSWSFYIGDFPYDMTKQNAYHIREGGWDMKKNLVKNFISLLLVSSICMTVSLSGCEKSNDGGSAKREKEKESITLEVFNEYGSYHGIQEGWIADILKEKFNVELNITPHFPEEYEKRLKEKDLGDILLFLESATTYGDALKNGLLYDWNHDDLLARHGSYIKGHLGNALRKNQKMTAEITDGSSDALYGFCSNAGASSKDHQSFFYTWDLRWDLYKNLGYPKVNDLEDYEKLLKDMVKACPKDDSGNKTYAASLWSDWDETMVMYVKAMASAYYGYDELGIGLYDSEKGKWHGALEQNGPYLAMLKFCHNLYRDGLLDPDSRKQGFEEAEKKVKNGGTMCSIFNYMGSIPYNEEHAKAGKIMQSLKPAQASPIAYGLNMGGSGSILSIGAASKYPEKCMDVINWMSTPEGSLTMMYGPKGACWNYNDQRKTELTKLGKKCQENASTKLGNGYRGSFTDGMPMIDVPWAHDASNPETDGETYNYEHWESSLSEPQTEMEKDWQEKTGSRSVEDYFEKGKHTISPGTDYDMGKKPRELKKLWKIVGSVLVKQSWDAIYAESDAQYDRIVSEMIAKCMKIGYKDCAKWCKKEAAKRKALENALAN